jgi:hypothetical protein
VNLNLYHVLLNEDDPPRVGVILIKGHLGRDRGSLVAFGDHLDGHVEAVEVVLGGIDRGVDHGELGLGAVARVLRDLDPDLAVSDPFGLALRECLPQVMLKVARDPLMRHAGRRGHHGDTINQLPALFRRARVQPRSESLDGERTRAVTGKARHLGSPILLQARAR